MGILSLSGRCWLVDVTFMAEKKPLTYSTSTNTASLTTEHGTLYIFPCICSGCAEQLNIVNETMFLSMLVSLVWLQLIRQDACVCCTTAQAVVTMVTRVNAFKTAGQWHLSATLTHVGWLKSAKCKDLFYSVAHLCLWVLCSWVSSMPLHLSAAWV